MLWKITQGKEHVQKYQKTFNKEENIWDEPWKIKITFTGWVTGRNKNNIRDIFHYALSWACYMLCHLILKTATELVILLSPFHKGGKWHLDRFLCPWSHGKWSLWNSESDFSSSGTWTPVTTPYCPIQRHCLWRSKLRKSTTPEHLYFSKSIFEKSTLTGRNMIKMCMIIFSLKSKYKIALFIIMSAHRRFSACLLNELMNDVKNMCAYGQRSRDSCVKMISYNRISSFKVLFNLYTVSSSRCLLSFH